MRLKMMIDQTLYLNMSKFFADVDRLDEIVRQNEVLQIHEQKFQVLNSVIQSICQKHRAFIEAARRKLQHNYITVIAISRAFHKAPK